MKQEKIILFYLLVNNNFVNFTVFKLYILKVFKSYNGNTKVGYKQTPGQTLFW